MPPLGLRDIDSRRGGSLVREVYNKHIHGAGIRDNTPSCVGIEERGGVSDDCGTLLGEDIAKRGAHELGCLGDKNALA